MPYDSWKKTLAPFIAPDHLETKHPDELNSPEMERCFRKGSFIPSIPAYWTGTDDEPSPDKDIPTAWLREASTLRIFLPDGFDAGPFYKPIIWCTWTEVQAGSRRAADTFRRFLKETGSISNKTVQVLSPLPERSYTAQFIPQLSLLFAFTRKEGTLYKANPGTTVRLELLYGPKREIFLEQVDFLKALEVLHKSEKERKDGYCFTEFLVDANCCCGLVLETRGNREQTALYSDRYRLK